MQCIDSGAAAVVDEWALGIALACARVLAMVGPGWRGREGASEVGKAGTDGPGGGVG